MLRYGPFERPASIRLSPPLKDRIHALARSRGQRPSETLRDLLWRGLDSLPAVTMNAAPLDDTRPELAADDQRRN